jgi:predicted aspartyl protease
MVIAGMLSGFSGAIAAGQTSSIIAPLPPAKISQDLEVGGEAIEVRRLSMRLAVDVKINGRGPFRFIVDSGADTSVISSKLQRALQLPFGTPVILNGTAASSRVERVLVDTLQVSSSVSSKLELPVLDERALSADGLIGIDALAHQRLMLDFEQRLVRIGGLETPPLVRTDGEIVVTARRRRGQLILAQARVNGTLVDAIIDTGSDVTIGNLALRQRLTRRSPSTMTPITVSDATGATASLEMLEAAELRIGSIRLQNVPVAFAQLPPFTVFGLTKKPALLLGTNSMETFGRVSLDFNNRRVRFQLRRCKRYSGSRLAATHVPTCP